MSAYTEPQPPTGEVFHISEGDAPMLDGYAYSATGFGVRQDAIEAVMKAWASISPNGDPATTLRSVNDGYINRVDSLARITAQGFLQFLVSHGWGPRPRLERAALIDHVARMEVRDVPVWDGVLLINAESMADALVPFLRECGIEVTDDAAS